MDYSSNIYFEKEDGMYRDGKDRFGMISTFLFSLIPLAFPWFAFDLSIDGQIGFMVLSNPAMILAILLFGISVLFDNKKMNVVGLLALCSIPLVYIYYFLTWHYQTITGEINIMTSIQTAQFGFYLGMLMSIIMIGYYIIRWKFVRR